MKQGFLVVLWNGLFSEGGKEGPSQSVFVRFVKVSYLTAMNVDEVR